MQRDQQAAPLPPDPTGREDIVPDDQREEDVHPGNRKDTPLPRDPAGPEDVIGPEPQDGPASDG
jgi:hypothetical protein